MWMPPAADLSYIIVTEMRRAAGSPRDDNEPRQALNYRPLQDIVRAKLRSAILAGRHEPGERLAITAIARRYGVSAIPVREALRGLEAEGIVQFSPNRGAVVKQLTREELREIFLIRLQLEGLSLREAIPNLVERDFTQLEELLAQIDASVGDANAWLDANQRFHLNISKAARLPRLYYLLTGLWVVSRPYMGVYMARIVNPTKAGREHVALLQACRRRDIAAAMSILEEHVADTQNIVVSALAEAAKSSNR
jgi:DNA-binding GntR family transcriptional regulator